MKLLLFAVCMMLIAVPVLADSNIVTIPTDGQLKICQIDYGYNVSMTTYSMNMSISMPATQSWELLGSINAKDYTLLDTENNVGFTANVENGYSITDTSPYRYFALTMTKGFYQPGTLTINFTTSASSVGTPAADFYSPSQTTTLGSPTGFVDSSTNTPVRWYWIFGDGSTSTVQNPYHTYGAYGYYTVNHSATNKNGLTAWNNKTNFALIEPASPVIITSFTGTPTSGLASLNVAFTDTSIALPYPVTSWSWNFGDTGTSVLQNPAHTYNTPGTYSVSLTTTNANATNSTTYVNYITANAPIPSTAFIKSFANNGATTAIIINRYNHGALSMFNPDTLVPLTPSQTLVNLPDSTTLDTIPTLPAIAFYGDDGSYWIYRTV